MDPRLRSRVPRQPLVALVCVCLGLAAILVPVGAHLPRMVEAELVLAVWWGIWVPLVAWLLYRGHDVDDDSGGVEIGGKRSQALFESLSCVDPGCTGGLFGEGCAGLMLGVLVALLLALAFVLLIEFVIPAVALALLASIGGMLARAVNDRHDCEGRLGLSLLWGLVWATLYVGPVAAVVALAVKLAALSPTGRHHARLVPSDGLRTHPFSPDGRL